MSAIEVRLPDLGEETAEKVELAIWHVAVGEAVAKGADLAEVTTDKAAFTLPAPSAGKLVERRFNEGDEVTVGAVICVLEAT